MKRTVKAVAVIICFVFTNLHGNAQVNDAGLWTSVNIEKKFTQKLSLGFTEELRFNENVTELGTILSDIGLMYKFGPEGGIRASINYRFSNKRNVNDTYSNRHRYYGDVTFRKKFGAIIPMYRIRLQSQYDDIYSSEDGREAEYYMRNRLILKYSPDTRYKPFIGTELYTRLRNEIFNRSYSDNVRYIAGVDFEFNERNALSVSYLVEREFNRNNPERNYVLSLTYGISL